MVNLSSKMLHLAPSRIFVRLAGYLCAQHASYALSRIDRTCVRTVRIAIENRYEQSCGKEIWLGTDRLLLGGTSDE